ncbi:VOC family protein [Nonomuraea soli]|uniref:VOC domain-containing protein n=1 Tax=Nonomuraea soli TaxID=1032476 RepID=A0A7W0HTD8_9ACTN|nr:VOC family protein [Nonomuraea soli]MBA2895014.1 hypothetical protein [Nonomuraea soli]
MLTTEYVPGAPNWIDLGSPDLQASTAFYTAVLGWTFSPLDDSYGFFLVRDTVVAAVGALTEEPARPAWMPYFASQDVTATTKAVEHAGGVVRVPRTPAQDGFIAQYTDPSGAEFAVLQPGAAGALGTVSEPGSLSWLELYVANPRAIRPFYRSVFDWRFDDMLMGDDVYTVVSTASGDDASIAGLGPLPDGGRAHWQAYFEVADCDATVARAQELGGTITMPATGVETVGRFAMLRDPHGARFAVITSEEAPAA